MHPYVHCSIIHGGQGMETSEVSSARLLDKEYVVHIYSKILLSYEKKRNTAIWDNIDGFWEYRGK